MTRAASRGAGGGTKDDEEDEEDEERVEDSARVVLGTQDVAMEEHAKTTDQVFDGDSELGIRSLARERGRWRSMLLLPPPNVQAEDKEEDEEEKEGEASDVLEDVQGSDDDDEEEEEKEDEREESDDDCALSLPSSSSLPVVPYVLHFGEYLFLLAVASYLVAVVVRVCLFFMR